MSKLASKAGSWYNEDLKLLCLDDVRAPSKRVIHLIRRLITMDTLHPHDQNGKHSPKTTFIYALIDPNTQQIRYIGKSNNPQKRLEQHFKEKVHTYKTMWLKSLEGKGQTPEILILEEVLVSQWQEREIHWIAFYREQGLDLANGTDGGDGVSGLIVSEATRRKISEGLTGKPRSEEARKKISKTLQGHTHSEETRLKISQKQVGKEGIVLSKESRQKISSTLQGHTVSPETRQKISEAKKGKPALNKGKALSEEHRQKIGEGNKGKQIPEEVRQKINKTTTGRKKAPFSAEHRQRLSEAHKGKVPWNKGGKHD